MTTEVQTAIQSQDNVSTQRCNCCTQ